MTLGKKLRNARLERELTLRQVADKVGVSFGFVAKVERDEGQPSFATIKALAKLYGLSLDELAK